MDLSGHAAALRQRQASAGEHGRDQASAAGWQRETVVMGASRYPVRYPRRVTGDMSVDNIDEYRTRAMISNHAPGIGRNVLSFILFAIILG